MIVTMKKVSMVSQVKDKEETLNCLQDLGLVHLESFPCTSPEIDKLTAKQNRVTDAYLFLAEFKPKEEEPPWLRDPEKAVDLALKVKEELQALKDKVVSLDKEISELEPWGNFNPEDFTLLADKGYYVQIYQASKEQLDKLPDLEDVVILRSDKKGGAFAQITKEPTTLEGFDEFSVPDQSLKALKEEREQKSKKIAELKEKARSYYSLRPVLKEYMDDLAGELEYQLAKANALEEGELTAFVGYVPIDREEELKGWARQNSIAIALTDPDEDDPMPTLTRNPRWLEIIRPVFDFLGTVPGYRELDISMFFLAFFVIFFAMIINDAAYGAIFLLAGLVVVGLSRHKKKKPPLAAWLFTCLGLATVIWGTVTGSWFGSPELIAGTFLESLVITPLVEGFDVYNPAGEIVYKDFSGQDVIKLLCFIIALIHLSIAQVWNFLQELANRSLKAVAQFAWICVNFGLFYLVLDMVMYFDLDLVFDTGGLIQSISLILILGGLSLVVIFGSQEGNFVKGVLAGLAGLLPTALGTVSAFGDIISYIRLFAVGLAGAEIAKSFNTMAAPLLEGNTIIAGVLILVLGHALNFVLCSLGVLVHGIRLNMLEFSGRLGMEWSGHKYNPFRARESAAYLAQPETQQLTPAAETIHQRL